MSQESWGCWTGTNKASGWAGPGSALAPADCCSSSSALMHFSQHFHSSQSTLIFLFSGWNISGRMDVSSWTGDRKMLPRCQMVKHPPCPAVPPSRSVETEECCSKGQTGSVKYKDRGCSRTNGLLFQCLSCGRLEAAYAKWSRLLAEAQTEAAEGNITEALEPWPFSSGIIRTHFVIECKFRWVRPSVMTSHTAVFVQMCFWTMSRLRRVWPWPLGWHCWCCFPSSSFCGGSSHTVPLSQC